MEDISKEEVSNANTIESQNSISTSQSFLKKTDYYNIFVSILVGFFLLILIILFIIPYSHTHNLKNTNIYGLGGTKSLYKGKINDSFNINIVITIDSINSAIEHYTVDNKGVLPPLPQLTSPAIVTSGTSYGYNIRGNTKGTPICAIKTKGTLPTQVAKVKVSGFDSCETLATLEKAVPAIKNYLLTPSVGGNVNYYIAESANGTGILVFATGMKKGATSNTEGYPIAYLY